VRYHVHVEHEGNGRSRDPWAPEGAR
jgi:hypothetical protein